MPLNVLNVKYFSSFSPAALSWGLVHVTIGGNMCNNVAEEFHTCHLMWAECACYAMQCLMFSCDSASLVIWAPYNLRNLQPTKTIPKLLVLWCRIWSSRKTNSLNRQVVNINCLLWHESLWLLFDEYPKTIQSLKFKLSHAIQRRSF